MLLLRESPFLSNPHNKTELIRILRDTFTRNGIASEQCCGDADVSVAKKAVELALHENVIVVADDTDIMVLLMYHWRPEMKELYFSTTESINKKRVPAQYSIKELVDKQPLTPYLLFAHSWGGCDTTSAVHNKG